MHKATLYMNLLQNLLLVGINKRDFTIHLAKCIFNAKYQSYLRVIAVCIAHTEYQDSRQVFRDVSTCGDNSSISTTGEDSSTGGLYSRFYRRCSQFEAWWSCAAMRLRYHTIEPHLLRIPFHFYVLPQSSTAVELGPENRFRFLRGSLVLAPGLPRSPLQLTIAITTVHSNNRIYRNVRNILLKFKLSKNKLIKIRIAVSLNTIMLLTFQLKEKVEK